jgi:tRNA (guanine-N7-)-methyltransferase
MLNVEDVIIEAPADGEIVDPLSWFDSPGPFELEIGSGKGGFLISRATSNPHIRMLGIEWANKFFKYIADRIARREIENVHVMRTDAKFFVMNHLPPECIDVLHLYHPDPWPKARHHKRRLMQPDFVEAALRALKPSARWLIQSDHEEYFHEMRDLLDARGELSQIPWENRESTPGPEWEGTNFEIKYVREGREIYRAAFVRSAPRP